MVDHVEFETSAMVDTFLQAWRSSGQQRFAYLYGRYARYAEVPLGVKAVVAFIYEVRWGHNPTHLHTCIHACIHTDCRPTMSLTCGYVGTRV
jgi:hypothetical protein